MKKLFIGALIALTTISFVACGNDTQTNNSANTNDTVTTEVAQEDNNKAEEEAEAKEKAEKEAEKKAKEEEAKEKAEAEAKEEEDRFNNAVTVVEIILNDSDFQYTDVTADYSNKIIFVNVGMDGVAQDMVLVKATGMHMDEYYYMEDSLANMCKTMHDSCGYHVQVNLINDANPNNVMLSVLDGSVIYSYMNE